MKHVQECPHSTREMQAAMMTLRPGGTSDDEPSNEHRGSEQWLFVISGSGEARIGKRRGQFAASNLRQARYSSSKKANYTRLSTRANDHFEQSISTPARIRLRRRTGQHIASNARAWLKSSGSISSRETRPRRDRVSARSYHRNSAFRFRRSTGLRSTTMLSTVVRRRSQQRFGDGMPIDIASKIEKREPIIVLVAEPAQQKCLRPNDRPSIACGPGAKTLHLPFAIVSGRDAAARRANAASPRPSRACIRGTYVPPPGRPVRIHLRMIPAAETAT